MRSAFALEGVAGLLLGGAALSCMPDPIHEREVSALGEEVPGVAPGPTHRSGQPCGACHDSEGPARTHFALAGTVYRTPESEEPLEGATVRFLDWTGAQFSTTTNCAGNFFVGEREFQPQWPMWVKVEYQGTSAEMISAFFRETSCNACHTHPAGPRNAERVYLTPTEPDAPKRGCP